MRQFKCPLAWCKWRAGSPRAPVRFSFLARGEPAWGVHVILTSNERRIARGACYLNIEWAKNCKYAKYWYRNPWCSRLVACSTKMRVHRTGSKVVYCDRSHWKFDEASFKHELDTTIIYVGNVFDVYSDIFWLNHWRMRNIIDDHATLNHKKNREKSYHLWIWSYLNPASVRLCQEIDIFTVVKTMIYGNINGRCEIRSPNWRRFRINHISEKELTQKLKKYPIQLLANYQILYDKQD